MFPSHLINDILEVLYDPSQQRAFRELCTVHVKHGRRKSEAEKEKILLHQYILDEDTLERYSKVSLFARECVAELKRTVFSTASKDPGRSLRSSQSSRALQIINFYLRRMLTLLASENFRIKETNAIRVVHGLAGALEHLKSMNIMHRDLKPENVLIRKDYIPLLCDFG